MSKIFEKFTTGLIYVCFTPIAILSYIVHIFEEAQTLNHKLNDKLFMRRFNFIDDNHFEDYIRWNQGYHARRALDSDFRYLANLGDDDDSEEN